MNNLIKNERTKLYKKASTWVIIGLVVGMILLGPVFQGFTLLMAREITVNSEENWEQSFTSEMNMYQEILNSSPEDMWAKAEMEKYRYLLDNDIDPDHWKYGLVHEYYEALSTQWQHEQNARPESLETDRDYLAMRERVEGLERLMKSGDWKDYVKAQIAEIQAGNTELASAEERQVQIEIWNMFLELNIPPVTSDLNQYVYYEYDSNNGTWQQREIQSIRDNKLALLRGQKDISSRPLSSTERENLENDIAISTYRLKTNTPAIETDSLYGLMESQFGSLGMLAVMMAVLGGGIIANEFNAGTVKLLLITPHRRQKVFWAKVLTLLELLAVCIGGIFVLHFLIGGMFYGYADIAAPYVDTLFGNVIQLPYFVVLLYKYLLTMLPVLMVFAFALMLSAVTRKPIAAVSVSLLFYMGGTLANMMVTVINTDFLYPIFRFMPFTHWNLSAYFTDINNGGDLMAFVFGMETGVADPMMTLGLSVLVSAVYILCFTWIAHDSFSRRDVK